MTSSKALFLFYAAFSLLCQTPVIRARRVAKKSGEKIDIAQAAAPIKKTWDSDGVPLEESNVALMDSDEAKRVRHEASTHEAAWEGVGGEAGLWVWRIESMKVVKWPKSKHGQFHKGDSYIVLQVVRDPDSDSLDRNIYFWLGAESSIDEKGVAAYKTVELDDYFDGEPTQNREVQDHESVQFRSLFDEVVYLDGGVLSGFNPNAPVEYRKSLMIVRKLGSGEKCKSPAAVSVKRSSSSYCVMELPLSASSLNQGDCFILDAGHDIHIWCGDSSSGFEKHAAVSVAEEQLEAKRHGKANTEVVTEDIHFCELIGTGSVSDIHPPMDDLEAFLSETEPAFGEGVLYELSDDNSGGHLYVGQGKLTLTEKGRGDLTKSMLNSAEVILVDTNSEIFLWIGSGASEIERRNAMRTAMTYLKTNHKSLDTAIHVFKEGQKISSHEWNKMFDN